MYMNKYVCGKLFTKDAIFELGIGIASLFSGMALNAFWKRALSFWYKVVASCDSERR